MSDDQRNIVVIRFTDEEKKNDNVLKYIEPNPRLPTPQFVIANKYAEMARFVIDMTPRCPQRTHALNDLKTSKDAAVCASLDL